MVSSENSYFKTYKRKVSLGSFNELEQKIEQLNTSIDKVKLFEAKISSRQSFSDIDNIKDSTAQVIKTAVTKPKRTFVSKPSSKRRKLVRRNASSLNEKGGEDFCGMTSKEVVAILMKHK